MVVVILLRVMVHPSAYITVIFYPNHLIFNVCISGNEKQKKNVKPHQVIDISNV